jgi:hypothetical protein
MVPTALRLEAIVVEPVTAREVEVAPCREVGPVTESEDSVARPLEVSEPKVAPPTALSCEEMVVEPSTAREVEVAACSDVAPVTERDARLVAPAVSPPRVAPPTAFNCPATVVEAVTAREPVVVPLCKEKALPVIRPVLDTEKRVVVATPADEEAMAKREVGKTTPLVVEAKIENWANGLEVPRPRRPLAAL